MRLLLVEDELKLATSIKKALETEGYVVELSHDGEEAYFMAGTEEYDLIILDIGLPKLSGLDVCKKLRNDKIKTPILMLTARDSLKNKVEGLDCGADDYLVKPFAFEELLARIRSLLRRSVGEASSIITVDSLTFDTTTKNVKRKDVEVELSAKEIALLEYFIHNPKQVLSKSQILEHVWGEEVDPFSNVVDVYVGYLRNKIDKPFKKEMNLVKTIKGRGYRFG